eukprot:m.65020 g.65020  ORF g.65020 m.65020 type:complete len:164 (+) comp7550_c0_seq1:2278-2769(+)
MSSSICCPSFFAAAIARRAAEIPLPPAALSATAGLATTVSAAGLAVAGTTVAAPFVVIALVTLSVHKKTLSSGTVRVVRGVRSGVTAVMAGPVARVRNRRCHQQRHHPLDSTARHRSHPLAACASIKYRRGGFAFRDSLFSIFILAVHFAFFFLCQTLTPLCS